MSYFIEVILPLALPKTFTYKVSEEEFFFLKKGMRVAVSFGKNRIYTALVVDLHRNPPILYEAKEIFQILDESPIVTEIQIQHWYWISTYYMCNIGDVYRGAMPSMLLLESETIISSKKDITIDEQLLTDDEFLIYEALQHQSSLKVETVVDILNKKKVLPLIQNLIQKNVITLHEEIQEEYKPKLVRYIRLNKAFEDNQNLGELLNNQKSEKRKNLILSYFQLQASDRKPISVKKLLDFSQISPSVLKGLIEKEIFEEYYIQEDRVNFNENLIENDLKLNENQHIAFENIEKSFEKKDICLLHGVTGSGKTEIYIKLIEKFLEDKKQVLYLLPEIALTTQLVSRLTKYFGNKVAVFHSKYSNNERVEVWNNVLNSSEKAQIIIGARSALFLPFNHLGLIIVDEEHEATFKQYDPSPRYHARDAGIVLASYHKSKVLLGSATPSIETYYNASTGKYSLVSLNERYGNSVLPEIQLVDLKDAYFRKKMKGHFSLALIESISEAFSKGEQVILFQNRRGFSPVLECMTCGHVPQCPNCDVSLTYHKFKNQLRCHYCSHSIAKPNSCHVCSSSDLTTKGFGTEQIEIELASLFPEKSIKRMDQDTTRGKYSFEKLIDGFKNREIDVLVGTQMLAKGLDFDNVSLVGIMNADNMLYHPDFRAFERSYQMMTQVAGRSGRSEKRGKVIIQTYNPLHNIIQQVTNNDYEGMYDEQLYERRIFKYPPFYRLIRLTLKNRDYEKLKNGSMWLYQVLQQNLTIPVLGPEEPAISRIRNEYIRTIIIKIPTESQQIEIKKTIQKILNSFDMISQFKAIKIAVNVDFY
ncbi:MAG TPA: primosomal protein N' [Flavobacterium lutivivi]|nr:primosomal protein N' [Flavobacterium lutivivi]